MVLKMSMTECSFFMGWSTESRCLARLIKHQVEMRIPREKADEEAVAAGEFSTKKFLQEPEEDTEDTTGKKGGKSEEKK